MMSLPNSIFGVDINFENLRKKSTTLKETRLLKFPGHSVQLTEVSVWITIVCEPELAIKLLPCALHFVLIIMPLTEA